jgi:hypothetical protein
VHQLDSLERAVFKEQVALAMRHVTVKSFQLAACRYLGCGRFGHVLIFCFRSLEGSERNNAMAAGELRSIWGGKRRFRSPG